MTDANYRRIAASYDPRHYRGALTAAEKLPWPIDASALPWRIYSRPSMHSPRCFTPNN